MRNLIEKYRKRERRTALADAQPRGVHHTVKFDNPYNETWDHIWEEIKNIGISFDEERKFESQEIYSYAAETPAVPVHIEHNVPTEVVQQGNFVKLNDIVLVPLTVKSKCQGISASLKSIATTAETNESKAEISCLEIQPTLDLKKDEPVGFALTITEKSINKDFTSAYQYDIEEDESTISPSFGEFYISSYCLSSEYLSSTTDEIYQGETDVKLSKNAMSVSGDYLENKTSNGIESIHWRESFPEQPDKKPREECPPPSFEDKAIPTIAFAQDASDLLFHEKSITKKENLRKPNMSRDRHRIYRDRIHSKKRSAPHLLNQDANLQVNFDVKQSPVHVAMKIPIVKNYESVFPPA